MFNEELVPVVKTLVIFFTQDLVTLIARIKKRRKLLIKDRSRSGYVLVKIGSACRSCVVCEAKHVQSAAAGERGGGRRKKQVQNVLLPREPDNEPS